MQKIAILKAANKKSSLKRPIWDAIYSRRKNKIHAHGLTKLDLGLYNKIRRQQKKSLIS